MTELTGRFGDAFESYASEEAGLAGLSGGTAGLVHLSLYESDEIALPDLAAWLQVMAPGAVMVVTTTASDASSNFAKAKQHVTDTYPAVSVSLGLTTEAVVAQRPDGDATPIVDMLRNAPFAVGAFLALFGEQVELQHLLQHEPEPSDAVRALIGRVIDQQHAERDAFLTALRVYKEETVRLSAEVAISRAELSGQIEAARQEREHLVKEFLDRVDQLSSKISTSAAGTRASSPRRTPCSSRSSGTPRSTRGTPPTPRASSTTCTGRRRGGSPHPSASCRGCSPGAHSPRIRRTARWPQSPIPSPTTSRSSSSTTTRRRPRLSASMRWRGRAATWSVRSWWSTTVRTTWSSPFSTSATPRPTSSSSRSGSTGSSVRGTTSAWTTPTATTSSFSTTTPSCSPVGSRPSARP